MLINNINKIIRNNITSYNYYQKRFLNRTIYIKGARASLTEQELKPVFLKFGAVEIFYSLPVIPNRDTKTLILRYYTLDHAIACFDELQGSVLAEKRIFLEYLKHGQYVNTSNKSRYMKIPKK